MARLPEGYGVVPMRSCPCSLIAEQTLARKANRRLYLSQCSHCLVAAIDPDCQNVKLFSVTFFFKAFYMLQSLSSCVKQLQAQAILYGFTQMGFDLLPHNSDFKSYIEDTTQRSSESVISGSSLVMQASCCASLSVQNWVL